jgi:hypothetical protein
MGWEKSCVTDEAQPFALLAVFGLPDIGHTKIPVILLNGLYAESSQVELALS